MTKIGLFSRLLNQQPTTAMIRRFAMGVGVAIFLATADAAVAQETTLGVQIPTSTAQMSIPDGYKAHHSVDLGGRMANTTGSEALYDTMVNMHSGPRVLGQTFEMHALAGNKHTLVDTLHAFGTGFGGDPYNSARLDFSKGKIYEFSGLFRRDRQYFDYDLLANPAIIPGRSIPIGSSKAPTGSLPWAQVNQSPVLFNTVRRITDTNLTLYPLSTFSYRVGYAHNTFEGPTLSPTYTIAKYDALLSQYQRNSTDDFLGAIDWKPLRETRLTLEEQITHYKADSYFTLSPQSLNAQEADGTRVALGNWDSETPYGISACNTNSMGSGYTNSSTYTILSAPQTAGEMPILNAACAAVTSYIRSQPTRITTPTEILRLQSSSIKNISMNGDFRYTLANMDMPHYYENVLGLSGPVRSITFDGYGKAHRAVISADFGFVLQATHSFSLADQVNFTSEQQPGYTNIPAAATLSTPTTAGNQTINYAGPLTPGTLALYHGMNGVLTPNYFGQEFLVNNLTGRWDATPRVTLSLTYRYGNRNIGQGVPHAGSIPLVLADPVNGTVAITENAGILTAAVRATPNWSINGLAELSYADNAFTAVSPRQMQRYRLRTIYKAKPWATISGAFNDTERHNNTNNNQAAVAAGDAAYYGPLAHEDHTRIGSVGAALAPNERYGLDFNYNYSDVYTATNVCFTSGASLTQAGTATLTASGTPNVCPGVFARGSTTQLVDFFAKDFEDAPTQYGSVAVMWSPMDKLHSNVGYRVSSVNGTRFYSDARDVAGSLVSTYQSPFVNLAYTMHPGFVWKAEYNFFGYGEGGPSGAPLCSTIVSITATVVPCTSSTLPGPTGLTEASSGLTAPRNFHANNVNLGVHYEF